MNFFFCTTMGLKMRYDQTKSRGDQCLIFQSILIVFLRMMLPLVPWIEERVTNNGWSR